MKYLGIKLAKEVKDSYSENYRKCWRKTEARGNVCHIQGLEDWTLFKCPVTQMNYRFTRIPIKIPKLFLAEIKKNASWLFYGLSKNPNSQTTLKKKNKTRGLKASQCTRETLTQSVVLAPRQTGNRVNPHTWSTDRVLRPSSEERTAFQQMVLRKLDIHVQKKEIWPLPNTAYKDQLKVCQGRKCRTWNNKNS